LKIIKCKLKACLNFGKDGKVGICEDPIPTIIKELIPNKKTCPHYTDDYDADIAWVKKKGGIMNLITTNKKDRKKRLKEVDDE